MTIYNKLSFHSFIQSRSLKQSGVMSREIDNVELIQAIESINNTTTHSEILKQIANTETFGNQPTSTSVVDKKYSIPIKIYLFSNGVNEYVRLHTKEIK